MERQNQQLVDELSQLYRRVTDLEMAQAQLAEQLHESEARYHRFADHVTDVIWTMDMDFHFTDVTPSITPLLGLTVEEARQRHLGDALTPASLALVMQVFKIELAQAQIKPTERFWSRTLELEYIHKDGHLVPVEVKLSLLYDEHNLPVGMMGIARDITARKQMEEKLRENDLGAKQANLLLHSIMESPQGVVIFALDQNFCYTAFTVTHQATMQTLWGVEIKVGMNMLDAISDPLARAQARHNFERALRGEQFILTEEYGDPSKYRTYYEDRYSPIKNETGDIIGLTVFVIDITARKQAEEQLRESEERFRSLLDSQTSNIMMLDFEGVHHYVNQVGVVSMIGSGTAQDILGKRLHDLYPPHIADWQLEQIRRVMTTGQGLSGDYETKIDKPTSWWHLNLQPIRNASGQVALVMVNSLNITERKRAEVALRESEERFRTLANTAPVLIWMAGPDALCNFFNQPWLDFTGRTMEQELGNGWAENIHADDLQTSLAIYRNAFDAQQPFSMEYRLRRADGAYRWIVDHGVPRFLPDGTFVGYIGSCLDITERKRMEETLHETNAYLENLINYANAPIIVWDPQFRITRFNHAFESMTGHREAEVLGQSLELLFPPELAASSMDLIRQTLTGARWEIVEIKILHRDGSVRTLLWNSATLFAPDGKTPIATIAQGQDITERKRMEEELRESEAHTAAIVRLSPVVIGVSTVAEGRYTDVNDAFETVLGYSRSEAIGRTSHELSLWVDNDTRSLILRELQAHGRVENLEIRLRRKSGEIFPALMFITPIVLRNTPCLIAMMMDITERKQAEVQLRETRDALQAIIYASPLAILTLDAENLVTMWNPAAEELFGWSDKEILGRRDPTVPGNKISEYLALRKATMNGMAFSNLDTMRQKKGGALFPVSLSTAPMRGNAGQVVGQVHVIADITERKRAEEQLRHMSTHDPLTGVYNRVYFETELARLEQSHKFPISICIADIDNMKRTNDTLGHTAGDELLKRIAQVLKSVFRASDTLARIGGDEFALILPGTDRVTAERILARIRENLAGANTRLPDLPLALSLGMATAEDGSLMDAFELADTRMYEDKRLHKQQN